MRGSSLDREELSSISSLYRIDVPSQFVVVPWRGTEIHIIVLVFMAKRRRMDQSWAAETNS